MCGLQPNYDKHYNQTSAIPEIEITYNQYCNQFGEAYHNRVVNKYCILKNQTQFYNQKLNFLRSYKLKTQLRT